VFALSWLEQETDIMQKERARSREAYVDTGGRRKLRMVCMDYSITISNTRTYKNF
jgi:hypothetical protein